MKISLRGISRDDGPRIVRWRNRTDVRKWFWNSKRITLAEHNAWFDDYDNDVGQHRWIIEVDGKPVGSVGFTDRFANSAKLTIYIGEPKARGKGVAVAALEMAFKEGRNLGLYYITAEVKSKNKAALNLYAKVGFRVTAKTDEAVTMQKELT